MSRFPIGVFPAAADGGWAAAGVAGLLRSGACRRKFHFAGDCVCGDGRWRVLLRG